MNITYRNYQDKNDLTLQTDLWIKATNKLPYAWKPNLSQKWYSEQPNFDPKSKMFAYDNDIPVAYMSCISRSEMTPMGFPWALEGYEGEIQHYMFDTVYNYTVEHFSAKKFLQRFRSQWTYQTNFFKEKNFQLELSNPIFVRDLTKNFEIVTLGGDYQVKLYKEIPESNFKYLMQNDNIYKDEDADSAVHYVKNDIQVDWYLEILKNNKSIGMSCVTTREDTKYSEIVVLICDNKIEGIQDLVLNATCHQLKKEQVEQVSMTVQENSSRIDFLSQHYFNHKSNSVFYGKEI